MVSKDTLEYWFRQFRPEYEKIRRLPYSADGSLYRANIQAVEKDLALLESARVLAEFGMLALLELEKMVAAETRGYTQEPPRTVPNPRITPKILDVLTKNTEELVHYLDAVQKNHDEMCRCTTNIKWYLVREQQKQDAVLDLSQEMIAAREEINAALGPIKALNDAMIAAEDKAFMAPKNITHHIRIREIGMHAFVVTAQLEKNNVTLGTAGTRAEALKWIPLDAVETETKDHYEFKAPANHVYVKRQESK
jgi:hypothetical protein